MGILAERPADMAKQMITLELPANLCATAQEAVSLGLASSQSDFIAESIRRRAREVRHAQMAQLADEAMADPRFVADMMDTMEAFRFVDAEGWPEYDEEAGDEA